MAQSLLESLGSYVTPDLVARVAGPLGESQDSLAKGLGVALPALFGSLADRAQEPGALAQLFGLLTDPANDGSVLRDPGHLAALASGGSGGLSDLASRFLQTLFGSQLDSIAAAIADFAGLKRSSVSSLLRLGAPLVMGLVGDRVRREGLGASGLASWLLGQRDAVRRALPGAIASALPHRPSAALPAPAKRSGLRWLLPTAIGLLLLVGLWNLLRGTPEPRLAERPPAPAPDVAAAPPAGPDWIHRALPGGIEISVPENGLESQLLGLLADPSRPLDETAWIDFDRLLFETDSATLKPSSRRQLDTVAQVLKAYPSARIKVGGYTDDTGDPAHNLELSRARAENVRAELVALGVSADRIEAEGYGQDHPVASNETAAGRAQNRRIAMRVTAR
jgi:OOP family OmpA-OmpF porin